MSQAAIFISVRRCCNSLKFCLRCLGDRKRIGRYQLETRSVDLNMKRELQEMQRVGTASSVQKPGTNNWICRLTVTTWQINFVYGIFPVIIRNIPFIRCHFCHETFLCQAYTSRVTFEFWTSFYLSLIKQKGSFLKVKFCFSNTETLIIFWLNVLVDKRHADTIGMIFVDILARGTDENKRTFEIRDCNDRQSWQADDLFKYEYLRAWQQI